MEQLEITIKDLLESGAHFGHQKHRWNPKMKRFIFEERNGIYIIDLAKTMQQLRTAMSFVRKVVGERKSVLFVGTKKQAKEVMRECAEKCGEYYVCERWLGGMLTNLSTIRRSVKTLEGIEKKIASGGVGLTKKEISLLNKDRLKLEKNLSGVRSMRKVPGLLVLVDPGVEHIARAEANKLGIPIIALVDTNCDPDPVDYVVPCNDDSLKSIKLIIQELTRAITEVKSTITAKNISKEKGEESEEEARITVREEEKPSKEIEE